MGYALSHQRRFSDSKQQSCESQSNHYGNQYEQIFKRRHSWIAMFNTSIPRSLIRKCQRSGGL